MLETSRSKRNGHSGDILDKKTKIYDRAIWKARLREHDEKLQKKRGLINNETPTERRRKVIRAFVIFVGILILIALIYPHIQVKVFRLLTILLD